MMITNTSKETLISELQISGSRVRGNSCTCPSPSHDDRHPSAGIYSDSKGVWRYKCQACEAGGDVFDLIAMRDNKPLSKS